MKNDPLAARRAHVIKAGVPAATLTRADDRVTFAYLADYLDAGLAPVASTLPLTDEPLVTPGASVPAFFANLLPEGRRLTSLRQHVKTSADDDFSLLVAVGSDPVGDVQVVADLDAEQPSVAPVTVGASFEDIRFRDLLEASHIDPAALAGAQDKVSGRMITIPLAHHGRAHILKLTPPEFPRVVENENYFLSRAARMKASVAKARVVHDADGEAGLLVERFDRAVQADGTLRRVAVEDGAQILGRYPADKYTVSAEQLARRFGELASSSPLALQNVLRQITFAWITGNGDQHAKNFSLLSDGQRTAMAPIYDVPSTVPYNDHSLALSIDGQRKALSRKRLLSFADAIGLPLPAAERAIDDAVGASGGIEDDIAAGAISFDARRTRDLVRNVSRRRATVEG